MNAKEEFIRETKGKSVKCVILYLEPDYDERKRKYFRLPTGYTHEQLESFLTNIDFTYDSGYGTQELFGYVWFDDGTWLERHEYDGSECWDFKQVPEIPQELTGTELEYKP